MEEKIQVIDLRENFYKVSNYIYNYNPDVYESGVYHCLCRFANNDTKESFPSILKIKKMIKVSHTKIISTLKSLAEKKTIHIKYGEKGKHNTYYLLTLSSKPQLPVVPNYKSSKRGGTDRQKAVVGDYSKKTNIKKTNLKKLKVHLVDKVEVFEKVFLKPKEIDKLIEDFGEEIYNKAIYKLSNYILSKGKDSYKSHNGALRNWVIEAVSGGARNNKNNMESIRNDNDRTLEILRGNKEKK